MCVCACAWVLSYFDRKCVQVKTNGRGKPRSSTLRNGFFNASVFGSSELPRFLPALGQLKRPAVVTDAGTRGQRRRRPYLFSTGTRNNNNNVSIIIVFSVIKRLGRKRFVKRLARRSRWTTTGFRANFFIVGLLRGVAASYRSSGVRNGMFRLYPRSLYV